MLPLFYERGGLLAATLCGFLTTHHSGSKGPPLAAALRIASCATAIFAAVSAIAFQYTQEPHIALAGGAIALVGALAAKTIRERFHTFRPLMDHAQSDFSDEILLQIFSYLPMKDLLRASCVKCSWRAISLDHTLWQRLYRQNFCPFQNGLKHYTQKDYIDRQRIESDIKKGLIQKERQYSGFFIKNDFQCLSFTPQDQMLAVGATPLGTWDAAVYLWNFNKWDIDSLFDKNCFSTDHTHTMILRGPLAAVRHVAWASEDKFITTSLDDTWILWNLSPKPGLYQSYLETNGLSNMALAHSAQKIAIACEDKILLKGLKGEIYNKWVIYDQGISLAFSYDDKELLVLTKELKVVKIEVEAGTAKLWKQWPKRPTSINPTWWHNINLAKFSPCAHKIAIAVKRNLYVWHLLTDRVDRVGIVATPSCLAFSPNSALLALGGASGRVSIWELARCRCHTVKRLKGEDKKPHSLAFSNDGTMLAIATARKVLLLLFSPQPYLPLHLWRQLRDPSPS